MLYAELEKLSAAWEALDRQVKSKVFDLSAVEEKVSKSNLEVRILPDRFVILAQFLLQESESREQILCYHA